MRKMKMEELAFVMREKENNESAVEKLQQFEWENSHTIPHSEKKTKGKIIQVFPISCPASSRLVIISNFDWKTASSSQPAL